MAFKKIRQHTGEEIIETRIKDTTGAEIEKWTVMASDYPRMANIIKKKLGLNKSKNDLEWALN